MIITILSILVISLLIGLLYFAKKEAKVRKVLDKVKETHDKYTLSKDIISKVNENSYREELIELKKNLAIYKYQYNALLRLFHSFILNWNMLIRQEIKNSKGESKQLILVPLIENTIKKGYLVKERLGAGTNFKNIEVTFNVPNNPNDLPINNSNDYDIKELLNYLLENETNTITDYFKSK